MGVYVCSMSFWEPSGDALNSKCHAYADLHGSPFWQISKNGNFAGLNWGFHVSLGQ